MGHDVGDIPFPPKRKKQRGEKSGGATNGQVGIALALLALPTGAMLWCLLFILHGYGVI